MERFARKRVKAFHTPHSRNVFTYLNARITFPKTQATRGLVARASDGQKTQVLCGLIHLARYGPKDTLAVRDLVRASNVQISNVVTRRSQ